MAVLDSNTEIVTSFENFELKILKQFQEEFKRLSLEEGVTKTTHSHVTIFTKHHIPFSSDELCDILQSSAVDILQMDDNNNSLPTIELGSGINVQILVERSKKAITVPDVGRPTQPKRINCVTDVKKLWIISCLE